MKSTKCFLHSMTLVIVFCFANHVLPTSAQINYYNLTDSFTVRSIDLCDSMYIIYAQRGDSIYKIYSRQEVEKPKGGEIILVGNTYCFCLEPLLTEGALRSSLNVARNFHGRSIRFYRNADYCVGNVFFAYNILDKRVYSECSYENRAYKYAKYGKIIKERRRLPKDITKIRPGNAANPKR